MDHIIRKAKSLIFTIPSGSNSGVSPNDTVTSGGKVPVAKNASTTTNPPDKIPENILAFRTITTLLGKIQQEKPLTYSNLNESDILGSDTKEELRITTAFANVANTHIEVIAIATNLLVDKVEVIACTNRDINNELIDHSPPSNLKISGILKYMFSSNPRRDDDGGHTGELPYIADTVAPPGVIHDDPETMKNYIEKEWCVDCRPLRHTFTSYSYKKRPSLYEHLWTLKTLLLMKDPEDLLSEYIITACFRKMIRRFSNKSLSKPYLESLKSVDIEKIVFHESELKFSQSDVVFFLEFLLPAVSKNAIFTNIPNILKNVHLIRQADDKAKTVHSGKPAHLDEQHEYIPIYTKDTYKEFHLLFIDLLVGFEQSLLKLEAISLSGDSTMFRNVVVGVKLLGTALRLLAKGAVLKIHLKTIESSLKEHRRVETMAVSTQKLNEDFKEKEQDEVAEQDEDLKAVQPQARDGNDLTQQMPLHVSYLEWLKLMLVYFDAIDVLKQYVTGSQFPFKTIDIKILVSPRPSTTLLPWQDIFNSKWFSANLAVEERHLTSDTELLNYFEEAAASNIYLSLSLLKNALHSLNSESIPDSRKAKEVKHYLDKLVAQSTVPGWNDWAKGLLNKFNLLSGTAVDLDGIGDAIQLMLEGNQIKFFSFLRDVGPGNKKVFIFDGTIHCEVFLSSFLVYSKVGTIDGYEDIRTQLKVA